MEPNYLKRCNLYAEKRIFIPKGNTQTNYVLTWEHIPATADGCKRYSSSDPKNMIVSGRDKVGLEGVAHAISDFYFRNFDPRAKASWEEKVESTLLLEWVLPDKGFLPYEGLEIEGSGKEVVIVIPRRLDSTELITLETTLQKELKEKYNKIHKMISG